jgi:branched-chain amino acid transport system substrate-binding protein
MSWTRQVAAIGCAAVALAAVGCGSSDDSGGGGGTGTAAGGGDKGPFKMLAVLPLSGDIASIGDADRTAIQVGVDQINKEGGILGQNVEIKFVDSAGTATQAVNVLQKELSGGDYNFVIAGATSGEAVPMEPFLQREKVLSCTSAAADVLNKTPTYLYGTSTLSSRIGGAVVEAVKAAGYKKVGAMFPDTELARSTLDAVKKAAADAGIELNAVIVDPTAIDLTTQMSKLRDGNPEALIVDGYGPVAPVMLKARATLGWDVPVIGDSSMGVNDFTSLVGKSALDGVQLNMQQVDLADSEVTKGEAFQTFLTALKAKSPELPFGMEVYADNYSCPLVARAAAEKANSTDGTAMRDALAQVSEGSQIKGWFLADQVYSSDENYPQYDLSTWWQTVPVGVRKDGLMIPGKG